MGKIVSMSEDDGLGFQALHKPVRCFWFAHEGIKISFGTSKP